jgi:hypothetical protein
MVIIPLERTATPAPHHDEERNISCHTFPAETSNCWQFSQLTLLRNSQIEFLSCDTFFPE